MELSSPTFTASMSKAPNWLTVPLETSSPSFLSTGIDSPVITAWFIEVCPEQITPSTGIVSPGSTRRISPTRTLSAGTVSSFPFLITRAVCGVKRTSFSIPALAFATVRSSSSAPSCIIKTTSPAAKSSPIHREAIRAIDTSTSALMSKAVTSPITASRIIGIPHRITEIQAASNGKGTRSNILTSKATPDTASKAISFFMPPVSRISSILFINLFIIALLSIPMGVYVYYTYRGIGMSSS